MSLPFVEENTKSRQRLETLAAQLTDADLARKTSFDWTVAALLAHLAFWEQRMLTLLHRWQANGFDTSPTDADMINGALKPLCHALNPRAAIELALSSAKAIDAELEKITPEFYEHIQKQAAANSTIFRFARALHRNDHVNDIESLIKKS